MQIFIEGYKILFSLIKIAIIPAGIIAGIIILLNFEVICKLIYWKSIDLYRYIKLKKSGELEAHLYGIWCFIGIYGGGKTMSLVEYLECMRRKYGNKILIATNFFYENQDFNIECWRDLQKKYKKPVIFAYDELQNVFNSRDYRTFPPTLMHLLTQNRKGRGKQIVYTTQDYETVDKSFRRLTQKVVQCKTRFGRLTSCKTYTREDFENLQACSDVKRRMKIKPLKRKLYVQTDYLRGLYDSYQYLETALSKEYMGLNEKSENNS
ncbi:MAG: zonular occludens toxin domain-containing protein [Oscillospiraceae bacterium]|nr:zonular occludens toxin domain-containing protein [Oscillospiraceae bacterium]